ncbi:hypothetical protein [Desertibacillus haloalkaliphilus]|uniref:hypothetical protein n=1 Tax=Desertibacillus haloalkaliphilus TaxID=1328930 RepID=UPI001C254131|nr:hypothetical protein [Desertibacillus haloalkaliphilus]
MKPKTIFKLVILSFCIVMIGACSANEKPTVEEQVMKRVPFPKSTNILHIEDHRDGKIILYKDETGFRSSYYIEKDDYFQSTSNAQLNPEDGFEWTMDNNPNLAMFSGVITDKNIKEVIVKQRTVEQQAKIIDINDGKRYWFTTFDELEDPLNGEPDPLKIEAYDKEGNLYWKSGVYEDGLFEGNTN